MNYKALIVFTTLLLTVAAMRNEKIFNDEEEEEPFDFGSHHFGSTEPPRFWGPHNYPNPGTQKEACKIPYDIEEYICDPDNQLTLFQVRRVASVIEKVKDYPRMCLCGDVFECDERSNSLHIGIALMKHLAFNTTNRDFAWHIKSDWKLGECSNNLLIFLATEDKEMRIVWGRRGSDLFLQKFRIEMEREFLELLANGSVFDALFTILEKIYNDLIHNHY